MSNVFIKDKNITVKFPDDMSSDEIGNIIRKNIYGEDLEKTPDSFPDKVVSGVKSTWRGIQEPIFSSPTVAGALMQEIGETFESGPTQEDFTLAMGGIPGPAIFNMVKRQVGKRTNIDENIANAGKELISHNQDFLKNRQIKPEEGKINEFLFNLGSGVTSLASALAITKITGSPHAAATLFGVLQKGRIYKEAIESGKTPEESARLSYVAGGAEAGLEYIGLHFMLEKYGGRFRRMAIRSGIEGLQEFLQTTSENVIVRLGGIDKARNILEGAGQSALIGFILGSPASVAIDLAERNGVKEALLKTGIDEESANKVLSKVVEAVRKETGKVTAEEVSIMNNKANEVKPEEAELAPREVSDKVPLPKGELGGAKQKVRADLNEAGFDIGIANKAIESGKSFEEVLSFITGSVGKDKDIMVNTVGFSENLRAIMEAGETLDIETPTPSPEQQADPLTQEALKYDTAEEFVNANIGEDKFKFGGESVFHETSPDAAVGFGNVVVDKSGMFVSDDPAFALGQKGKGALVEFDKEHLKSDRGVLSKAKVLANEIFRGLGQAPKEFILHGGSASPTTVKSITIKPDTKLQPRNLKTLKRRFNQEQLEDGSVKFTPKWLDNRTQQLTDIYNKAQAEAGKFEFGAKEEKKEVPKKEPRKKSKFISDLEERLVNIDDAKARQDDLKSQLEIATPLTDQFRRNVKRFKDGYMKKELDTFPKGFFTIRETAMFPDEALDIAQSLNPEIKTLEDLADALIGERQNKAAIQKQIDDIKEKSTPAVKEGTKVRQRLKDIEIGIREGTIKTKDEIKAVQTELVKILESSNLELRDRAKFIRKIKNMQTPEQLLKALPDIATRISKLEVAASTRNLKAKIKKVLKTTKAKKQAGKPVGKFVPEVQEVLDLMRKTALMSKTEAEAIIQQNVEATEGLLPSEDIRLKNELLSFMSGLDEKTPASLKKILDVIEEMKVTGKIARRFQRLEINENIIKKKELVISQVTGSKGIKEGRETVGERKTTTQKFKDTMKSLGHKMILSWSGLMDGLEFNAGVDNKILVDEFNTLTQDNEYKRLTEEFTKDLTDALASAYGIDKGRGFKGTVSLPWKIGAKINELQQEVKLGKFTNAAGVEVDLVFARDELIKKWMELQDDTLRESFEEGNKFTEEIIIAIDKKLTSEDKAFAKKQFEVYEKQWKKINPIYRKLYGANLPFNEFYSPIARENFDLDTAKGFGTFIHDATTRLAVTSGAFKTRVKSKLPIRTQSSIAVLERHIKETNYFVAWAEQMKVFETVFKDPTVREAITQEFTKPYLGSIDNSLNDFSTNGNRWSRRVGVVEFFRKNFTLGKLMIKPSLFAKQLVSTMAYLEKVNPIDFTVGIVDYWKHPIENYQTLKNESVLIRTRGLANLERDIKNATQTDAVKAFTKKQNFINLFMMNVKLGDKQAIIMGSWALRKKRLAEGADIQYIVKEYENFSAETQQSSDISRLSEVQRGGSFEKLFTMFKSAQRQYLQKELQAVKSLFQKGGVGPDNIKRVAKILAIYHILLPVAFQYIANFGGWDEEDQRDYIRAGILGSLNGLFIFGDIVDSIIRKALKLRVFSNEVPISTIANDVNRAIGKIDWDDITSEDVVDAMKEFSEAGDAFGIPVSSTKNMYLGVEDIVKGDIKAGVGEILGWSPRVVKKKKKKTSFEPF